MNKTQLYGEVTKEEIRKILNGMRSTMGSDGISVQILRECWDVIG